jgi:hypothetical protein
MARPPKLPHKMIANKNVSDGRPDIWNFIRTPMIDQT